MYTYIEIVPLHEIWMIGRDCTISSNASAFIIFMKSYHANENLVFSSFVLCSFFWSYSLWLLLYTKPSQNSIIYTSHFTYNLNSLNNRTFIAFKNKFWLIFNVQNYYLEPLYHFCLCCLFCIDPWWETDDLKYQEKWCRDVYLCGHQYGGRKRQRPCRADCLW